jgi:hypothetical protein
VLEGPQFRHLVLQPDGSMDLDAFAALWPHLRVMARCTPADKYTLVQVGQGAMLLLQDVLQHIASYLPNLPFDCCSYSASGAPLLLK